MVIYGNDLTGSNRILTYPIKPVKSTSPRPGSLGEEGYSEHSSPIPYSWDAAVDYRSDLLAARAAGKTWDYVPDKNFPVNVRCELYRFYMSLLGYEASEKPFHQVEGLIWGLTDGPSFITKLKRQRSYMLVISKGGHFLEDDDDILSCDPPIHKGELQDIGQMFNPRFYFFWDQPDEHDEKWFFEPVRNIPQSDIDRLEEVAYNLLPDEYPEIIQPEEILLESSSSSGKDPKTKKSAPVWQLKQKYNHFSDRPLVGYGSYIQKCPGDTRFSTTLSVPHSNSVKLIERQVALIVADMPWSNYVRDDVTYFRRYERLKESGTHFLCRDLRKDGITKVRPLIQALCRVLKKKYPGIPAWEYLSIYDDYHVYIDGVKHNPPRGYGLGMCSALTTYLQVCMFTIARSEMLMEEDWIGPEDTLEALFYNDDAAVAASSDSVLCAFADKDIEVLERYGQLPNKKKSWRAPFFVLCENYSDPDLDRKESYQTMLLKQVHACENIVHAKLVFATNLRYIHQMDWSCYLEELVDHFGFEFYYNEADFPYQLGGWVPAYFQGVDITLATCDFRHPKRMAAAMASKLFAPNHWKQVKKYSQSEYYPPVLQVYPRVQHFAGHEKDYKVGMTEREVASSHIRYKSSGMTSGYWQYQYRKRQDIFIANKKKYVDYKDFVVDYISLHEGRDILPPDDLLVREPVEDYLEVEEVYRPPNPYVQFLKFHNPEAVKTNVIPWPYPPGMGLDRRLKFTAEDRRQAQYLLTLMRECPFTGELCHIIPTERFIPSTYYYNPMAVVAAMMAVYYSESLPRGLVEREDLKAVRHLDTEFGIKLSKKSTKALIETFVRTAGWRQEYKDLDITYVWEDIRDIVYKRRLAALEIAQAYEKMLDVEFPEFPSVDASGSIIEEQAGYVWSDSPLSDSGFFNWRTSKRNYRDFRQVFFERLDSKVLAVEIHHMSSFKIMDSEDPPAFAILDDVDRYYYERSGGLVDERGYAVVYRSALDIDEPDAEVDFFAQGGSDEESEPPLFEDDGW